MDDPQSGTEARITERFAGLVEGELHEKLSTRPENVESGMKSGEGDELKDLRHFYESQGMNLTDEDLKARADELERASRRSVLVLEEKSNGGVKAAEK